jgi:transmembrane sensor
MVWPFIGRRERVRRQASDWIAKFNGPHGEGDRAAFERWYRASPDHAATYDRLSAVFEMAGNVRPARAVAATPKPETPRIAGYAWAAAAATIVCGVLAFTILGGRSAAPPVDSGRQLAVFVAANDAGRLLRLVDGSEVELSPGARLRVDIDSSRRRLWLERGEGRFVVFHDGRPFVVAAEGATITARGTQFRVRLDPEGTLVSLIEGRIDVSYAASSRPSGQRVASLRAGQHLLVPAAPVQHMPAAIAAGPTMIEFDDVTLGEAVEQINRSAAARIRLADPALEKLRVTGAFRAGDAEAFAQSVAAALNLQVVREPDGGLVLHGARQSEGTR